MPAEQEPLFPASPSGGGPSDPPLPRFDRAGLARAGYEDLQALDLKFASGFWTLKRPVGGGRVVLPPPDEWLPTCPLCLDGLALEAPTPDPCPECLRRTDGAPSSPRRIDGWPTVIAPTTGKRVTDLRVIPPDVRPNECLACVDGLTAIPWRPDDDTARPDHLCINGSPCSFGRLTEPG